MKVYSLKKYAKKVGYPNYKKETTLENIQNSFEGVFSTLQNYPLEELEYCIKENKRVIIVKLSKDNYRLCEV